MKVKFCGMTNYEDVKASIDLGVDFVGFVFYKKSKRFIDYRQAREIIEKIKGEVKTVGVFVDESCEEIEEIMNFCGLDYAQVYKDCLLKRRIRVYRIKDKLPEKVTDGLLLFDKFTDSIGGSGKSFDFDLIKGFPFKDRLFIAGGISIENVKLLIDMGVYGVDLVSSVEAYPGKKDFEKMRKFMEFVRSQE
ncbi:phosphoribosylanthranilate isomerase [Hippea alviniae]|uniref:phosphoribosylanthranilate isomerase n=1 Tax=Hippea alviniae TaxID=1279027 RepID=UPI0003B63B00|nr:phosphoribosylanthranilate isomerase [Hippea alviniae]